MNSEIKSTSNSDGLQIGINQLYCYHCSSYFTDMNSFTNHKHNPVNKTISNDESEDDGDDSEMEVEIKVEPESTVFVIENCDTGNNKTNIISENCDKNKDRVEEIKESASNCANVRQKRASRQHPKRKTRTTTPIPLKPSFINQKLNEEKLLKITQLIQNLQNAVKQAVAGENNENRSCLENLDSVNLTCNSCFTSFTSLKKFHSHLKLNVKGNEENLSCSNNSKQFTTTTKSSSSTSKSQSENENSNASSNFYDENIPSPSDSNDNCQSEESKVKEEGEVETETRDVNAEDDGSNNLSDPDFDGSSDTDNDDESDNDDVNKNTKLFTIQKPSRKASSRPYPKQRPRQKPTEAHLIAKEECKRVKENADGKYPCPRDGCSKTFSRFLGLKLHVMDHNGQRPYKCEEPGCDRAFLVPRQLTSHVLNVHRPESEKPFLCSVCGKGFAEACKMNAHHRQKHSENERKIYKCTFEGCTKEYNSASSLSYHVSSHNTDFPFHCKFEGCTKRFKHKMILTQHEAITHSEDKRYQCFKCGMKVKQKRTLQNHLRLHEVAEKEQEKNQKEQGENPTVKFIALEPNCPSRIRQPRKFKCNVKGCGASFAKEESLNQHSLKHEKEQPEIRPFKCEEVNCTASFHNQFRLKSHVENVHKKIRNVLCNICGTRWPNDCALRIHLATHTGEKRFKCSFKGCNYASFHATSVAQHAIIHTNERCYKCTICDKGFNQPVTLKRHLLTHTGEKPHKCPHCPAAYPERRNLKNHMKKHEEIEKPEEPEESESDVWPEKYFSTL